MFFNFKQIKNRETIWVHPIKYLLDNPGAFILEEEPETKEVEVKVAVVTRPVWMKDGDVEKCVNCEEKFSLIRRKHHCRKCGKIYCKKCCDKKIVLEELGYKEPVLVCNNCINS